MSDPIPCPWCKTVEHLETRWFFGDIARVCCRRCCAQGPVTRSEPDAVRAWNGATVTLPLPDAVCDRLIQERHGLVCPWQAFVPLVYNGRLGMESSFFETLALARAAVRAALTGGSS